MSIAIFDLNTERLKSHSPQKIRFLRRMGIMPSNPSSIFYFASSGQTDKNQIKKDLP